MSTQPNINLPNQIPTADELLKSLSDKEIEFMKTLMTESTPYPVENNQNIINELKNYLSVLINNPNLTDVQKANLTSLTNFLNQLVNVNEHMLKANSPVTDKQQTKAEISITDLMTKVLDQSATIAQ